MANLDLEYFRKKLEQEQQAVEADLNKIGRVNVGHPNDWEVKPAETAEIEFRDEVADQMEEMEERGATEVTLEQRLNNVKQALQKITAGTYGVCELGGEAIEPERLEANPAARTCKIHMAQADSLD